MPTSLIVTMAGRGQRFRDAGYDLPKYRVEAGGRTLFAWSMESLRHFFVPGAHCVFVTREEDAAEEFIRREVRAFGVASVAVVALDAVTDGQATTALLAADALRAKDEAIAVYNIDTYVEPQYLRPGRVRGDGWIPCFPGEGDKWSFARVEADGRVVELREKQRISPHATIGLYWFSSFDLYARAYDAYYRDDAHLERGEKYIAPLYNQLIAWGCPVYVEELPRSAVHALGTPEDVRVFTPRTGM